ncbi:MAG: hypothetical protein IKV70_06485 [Phascolarctobacterium sp.]|nr:hypothetical protein [Phascolarctobacterium sp.]
MKKLVMFILTAMLLCVSMTAMAAKEVYNPYVKYVLEDEKYQETLLSINSLKMDRLPKVAVMYVNNSQTDFYKAIDKEIMKNFKVILNPYVYQFIDGTPYLEALADMGIEDLTTAERADILDAYEGSDIDYIIFLQIEPMLRKDKVTTFTKGKEMTAVAPFKILDLKNRKALYNGRVTRVGDRSTVFFKLGNKSVALEAIELINDKVNYEIKKRLPKYKRTDVNAFYENKSIAEAEASFSVTNIKETVNVN